MKKCDTMLKNKKYFLCFMILIVLLSGLTIVSATDNNTDATTNTITSDTPVTTTNDNTILDDAKEETTYNEYKETNTTTKTLTKQDTTNTNTKTAETSTVHGYAELIDAVSAAKASNEMNTR